MNRKLHMKAVHDLIHNNWTVKQHGAFWQHTSGAAIYYDKDGYWQPITQIGDRGPRQKDISTAAKIALVQITPPPTGAR